MKISFILSAVLALLSGCASDDSLEVRGEAEVVLTDGTRTGFAFDGETALEDDRSSPPGVSGHCEIRDDSLEVALSRPSDGTPRGIRAFEVSIADSGQSVRAVLGDVEMIGAPPESCTVTELYRDADNALAAVELECSIYDESGESATATAELHFAGCEVR